MKRSRILMTALVVLMILSFTVTTIGADFEPPVGAQTQPPVEPGTVDEDGDLIVDVLTTVTLKGETTLPDMRDIPVPEAFIPQEDAIFTDATPISPMPYGYIYSNLPWFYFSPDSGATRYQIAVYNMMPDPDVLVYTYKGMDACTGGVCVLQPTTALKYFGITELAGVYSWAVRSKVGGNWTAWSTSGPFGVLKDGFNSTFTTAEKNWLPLHGTWMITDTGYFKTQGDLGYVSSAVEKHYFVNGYVYEVKMKRKGDDMANAITFNGDPYPRGMDYGWNDGYLFSYKNDGYWSLSKLNNFIYEPIFDWTYSSYIKPNDWNTLTVMRGSSAIKLWINGHWLNNTTDTTFVDGFVGIGMFEGDSGKSPLLVDYAWLDYTTTNPYPTGITGDGEIEP